MTGLSIRGYAFFFFLPVTDNSLSLTRQRLVHKNVCVAEQATKMPLNNYLYIDSSCLLLYNNYKTHIGAFKI